MRSGDAPPPTKKAGRRRPAPLRMTLEEIREKIESGELEVTKLPDGWARGVAPSRWARGFTNE